MLQERQMKLELTLLQNVYYLNQQLKLKGSTSVCNRLSFYLEIFIIVSSNNYRYDLWFFLRVLIFYSDGIIALWAIRESKVIFTSSSSTSLQSIHQEAKKVTAACWACPAGTKAVVGYSNGDIVLWSVPSLPDSNTEQSSQNNLCQITPIYKLNLGYKAEKIPISKLRWTDADGKSSRLYVLGCSDSHSTNLLQVLKHPLYIFCRSF